VTSGKDDEEFFRQRGFGIKIGFGERPALIVIDMLKGFTDPDMPLGAKLDAEIEAQKPLLDVAHARDIPVIFLSSLDDPRCRLQGLHAGGVDYISKPFYAEEVLARVRVHLRIRQAVRVVALREEARLAELREAQRSILVLPEDLPEASFAVSYRPLGAAGGDIYDVLQLGDRLFAYLWPTSAAMVWERPF